MTESTILNSKGYCSICGRHKSDEESTPTYECEKCGTGVIGFAHGYTKDIEEALCDECAKKFDSGRAK